MRKYVSKFATQNWQGRSFNLGLAPLSAIIGGNMEGKSAVPSAMRVGLAGYSPEHGKSNLANWGFIGAENGATVGGVQLGFSDGTSMNYQAFEMRKGKVEVTANRMDVKVPPVLLDLHEEFFSLSGPKRTDFIFARMDMGKLGFAVEEITARLKKDVKVAEPSAETEAKLGEIIDEVEEADRDREEAKWTYQQMIDRIVEKISEHADTAQTTLEQMAGTVQGTTVLRGSDGPLTPFNADDLAKARDDYQQRRGAKQRAEKITADRDRLTKNLAALEAAVKGVPDHQAAIAKNEERAALLTKEMAGHESKVGFRLREKGELESQHAGIKTRIDVTTEIIKRLTDQHDKDKKAKCCPRCKSKGKGWEKALAVDWDEIEANERELKKLKEQSSDVAQKIALVETRLEEASKADDADSARQREINELNRKNAELRTATNTVKVSTIWGTTTTTETMSVATATAGIHSAKQQLGNLEQPGSFDDAAIEKARLEVVRLEELERAHIAKGADDLRAEEAKQRHALAKAEKEVAVAALKVMKALKTEMMGKSFGGFMQKVNRFTDGLFHNAKAGLDFRDGEIGYQRGATWVTLDHFSGTEKMLTYLGLAVALAEESPVRIVFVDEWLRDDRMRHEVAGRLADLQKADVIDQVVMIDTRADGYAALGFEIFTISQ